MNLGMSMRLEGTCEACGEHYQEHAADCPRGMIVSLCERFLALRCPVCTKQRVELNSDDWLECEACGTQYSTGAAGPYDVDTLEKKVIIDDMRNKVWNVVQFPDKGSGQIRLRLRITELEVLEREAKKRRRDETYD